MSDYLEGNYRQMPELSEGITVEKGEVTGNSKLIKRAKPTTKPSTGIATPVQPRRFLGRKLVAVNGIPVARHLADATSGEAVDSPSAIIDDTGMAPGEGHIIQMALDNDDITAGEIDAALGEVYNGGNETFHYDAETDSFY